ncbi:MAG: hypothetical protein LBT20_01720 [Clostridiales bacterium]|jgi:hypothetical protein|nr:hypothetical protein [Clostridiales bacterium]
MAHVKNGFSKTLFLVCLTAFFAIGFYQMIPQSNLYSLHYAPPTEQFIPPSTVKMLQGDFKTTVAYPAMVIRVKNEIQSIEIPISYELTCYIGKTVQKTDDLAIGFVSDIFAQGRIIDIILSENKHIVMIDRLDNFKIQAEFDESYVDYIEDFLSGRLLARYSYENKSVAIEAEDVLYQKNTKKYITMFEISQAEEMLLFDRKTGKIVFLVVGYTNIAYINISAVKEIVNGYIVLEWIYKNKNEYIFELLTFEMLDTNGSDVIIEKNIYIGESFVVFNNYTINNN